MTAATIESLARRVGVIEHHLGIGVRCGQVADNLTPWMSAVSQITEELFPGPFSCQDEFDPEYPDETYVVVNVEATGELREVVRRQRDWHNRIRALSPELSGKLRLSISPR